MGPSAITVGSTDSNNAVSYFSNYGTCTDIWAPGSQIKSSGVASDTAYVTYSGTSMACPHVSGAAALTLEMNPNTTSVVRHLQLTGTWNIITGLGPNDTNVLLNVGGWGAGFLFMIFACQRHLTESVSP